MSEELRSKNGIPNLECQKWHTNDVITPSGRFYESIATEGQVNQSEMGIPDGDAGKAIDGNSYGIYQENLP